ncbi:DUF309 domain-containing protein [Halobacteriovorax vibrionivorans]|uniref:DUF309 domain-containing protein n=1 Tax=Halobacteriovorax vibrionivorans TaxID=2152716 RepID=A0ABY0ID96_9BACT|nr:MULTISPECIES: DUF309 domain-containing protein [Halobacteriovorax]RZF20927.1 DUF309 domain-containing protein [Halobacteriovorax vibrionivorans]TGD46027.1 DUF309 domain-containing protein [Halobacteriovorax sp. Y22]
MEFTGEPETNALKSSADFRNNSDYLYAIDLINHGYYWECHAYLESLWNEHNRTDDYAILFKAIIKIAAGLLKRDMGQESACATHLERCLELLDQLNYEEFCGIKLMELKVLVSHMLSKPLESRPDLIIKLRL